MLLNLQEATGWNVGEVTMPGVWTHSWKWEGSENCGLESTRGGLRLGKLNWGGREECGYWLTSLSPGLPHQSLWSGTLPALRKCLLCPRWSLPDPQGPPWGRHCIVQDCGQFCFPCFIWLDWKGPGRSYQSCPRLRVELSLNQVSDNLMIVMIPIEVTVGVEGWR